jgi:hypothetical protein
VVHARRWPWRRLPVVLQSRLPGATVTPQPARLDTTTDSPADGQRADGRPPRPGGAVRRPHGQRQRAPGRARGPHARRCDRDRSPRRPRRAPPGHRHPGRQGLRPRGRLCLRHERPRRGRGPRRHPVDLPGARQRRLRAVRRRLVLGRPASRAAPEPARALQRDPVFRAARGRHPRPHGPSRPPAPPHCRHLDSGREHRAVDGAAAGVVMASARRGPGSPVGERGGPGRH